MDGVWSAISRKKIESYINCKENNIYDVNYASPEPACKNHLRIHPPKDTSIKSLQMVVEYSGF